jgi:hypothetical protein
MTYPRSDIQYPDVAIAEENLRMAASSSRAETGIHVRTPRLLAAQWRESFAQPCDRAKPIPFSPVGARGPRPNVYARSAIDCANFRISVLSTVLLGYLR